MNVLVQIWDGSTWTTQSVPAPAGATDTALLSVSCTSSSFCVAVGAAFTGDSSSDTLPFAIMWNGLSWSMAAGLNAPSGFNDTELAGVSCTGPAWCMAVGFATNTSTSVNETLAEQWDGATWSSSSSASAPGTGAEALLAVSCTGPSNCMAVGASSPNGQPFALPHTDPSGSGSGSGTTPLGFGVPGLQTSGSVNAHDVPHSPPLDIEVLAEQWNGTSWTVSPAAAPAGATDPEFDGVSCAGIGFCMATGFANLSSSISSFSEEWSNGTWSEVSVPSAGGELVEGVSCISPTSCTLAGETGINSQANDTGATYVSGSWNGNGWTLTPVTAPAGATAAAWTGVSCLTGGYCVVVGGLATGPTSNETVVPSNAQAPIGRTGYRLGASDGGVFSYGPVPPNLGAPFLGSMGGTHLNAPIVGMATMPSGDGYYLVGSDGGVFNFGAAPFDGSAGGTHLNAPIVGMAVTADGGGYWLVASDGGVFSYGDALFYGSAGSIHLNKPVVGVAATPNGRGYYLVASDGGVFTYGNATFAGSTSGTALNKPIVGMAVTAAGGYYLVGADGGVFNYGGAPLYGSAGGLTLNKPVVGIGVGLDGYYLVASDGGVFDYAKAGAGPLFFGSAGSLRLNAPIVGIGV